MELVDLASFVGTGLATFGATWATLVRPMKNRAADPRDVTAIGGKLDQLRESVDTLRTSVARLETRLEGQENSVKNTDRRVERVEERMSRTVTDEEFAAYTQQTTSAINGMTERLGRAIGALDAIR